MTKIQKIQDDIIKFFEEKIKICNNMDAKKVVAAGAAIEGYNLFNSKNDNNINN